MTRQFIWMKPDGSVTQPYGLERVMTAAKNRVLAGAGPFQVIVDGEAIGEPSQRSVTLDRLRRRLVSGKVGLTYRVRDGAGAVVFWAREVQAQYEPADTSGNDKVDVFAGEVYGRFANFKPRYAGAYVCKPSSQHRFGNAIDFFFDSLAHQDEVAEWAVANADRLDIEHVISRDRIWTRGVGWHAYTGDYHNHLHVDFNPNFSTSLPCGVRP